MSFDSTDSDTKLNLVEDYNSTLEALDETSSSIGLIMDGLGEIARLKNNLDHIEISEDCISTAHSYGKKGVPFNGMEVLAQALTRNRDAVRKKTCIEEYLREAGLSRIIQK